MEITATLVKWHISFVGISHMSNNRQKSVSRKQNSKQIDIGLIHMQEKLSDQWNEQQHD
jgi:hypothetical protein